MNKHDVFQTWCPLFCFQLQVHLLMSESTLNQQERAAWLFEELNGSSGEDTPWRLQSTTEEMNKIDLFFISSIIHTGRVVGCVFKVEDLSLNTLEKIQIKLVPSTTLRLLLRLLFSLLPVVISPQRSGALVPPTGLKRGWRLAEGCFHTSSIAAKHVEVVAVCGNSYRSWTTRGSHCKWTGNTVLCLVWTQHYSFMNTWLIHTWYNNQVQYLFMFKSSLMVSLVG